MLILEKIDNLFGTPFDDMLKKLPGSMGENLMSQKQHPTRQSDPKNIKIYQWFKSRCNANIEDDIKNNS